MRISICTRIDVDKITGRNGFGYATLGMVCALRALGYTVTNNDATADVEIAFDQPHEVKWTSLSQYHILYVPWESTELLPGWLAIMNQADEVWTPSGLIGGWFKKAGISRPIHIYEHGVEHSWAPQARVRSGPTRFLMVGAEASRKGGWDTVALFREIFLGSKDVELTIKLINSNWNGFERVGNVNYINKSLSLDELQGLFYKNDVYVYPSFGEGFGLTPLQAIATGMPTITVPAWAPYRDLLDTNLNISSMKAKSAWPKIHPGYMLRPSFEDIRNKMLYAHENFEQISDFAINQAATVHEKYDWINLTRHVFDELSARLNSRILVSH
jgi:glycosyltransferase involved in cell wall biosynthesis